MSPHGLMGVLLVFHRLTLDRSEIRVLLEILQWMNTSWFSNMHLWRIYLFLLLTIVLLTHCSEEANPEQGLQGSCPEHWVDATLTGLGCLLFNSTTYYTWEEANMLKVPGDVQRSVYWSSTLKLTCTANLICKLTKKDSDYANFI